jgi:hypothetical protein
LGPAQYAAAPQVFYFRPQGLWYLVYQTTDANYQPVFSTADRVDKPEEWTRPRALMAKREAAKWIDFWVICDERQAHLFYTRAHKEVMVMSAPLAGFPAGFRDPAPVLSPLIESTHVYRVAGPQPRYVMLYEHASGDLRRFALAEAAQLRGPWKTIDLDFAAGRNLKSGPGTEPWTNEVSHGELLRRGVDERLEIDPGPFRFLIQGMPAPLHKGDYPSLPWRLGLITEVR